MGSYTTPYIYIQKSSNLQPMDSLYFFFSKTLLLQATNWLVFARPGLTPQRCLSS